MTENPSLASERRHDRRIHNFLFQLESDGFQSAWIQEDTQEDTTAESLPCLLFDVSLEGCSLLVEKNQPELPHRIQIVCYNRNNLPFASCEMDIEERWRDKDYSIRHERVGVVFTRISFSARSILHLMMDELRRVPEEFIRCEVRAADTE